MLIKKVDMIIDWNIKEIERQLYRIYSGAVDSYETGYNNWPCKKDLYRVKFLVDELLEKCPTFTPEEEWLREQEAEKIIRILKK